MPHIQDHQQKARRAMAEVCESERAEMSPDIVSDRQVCLLKSVDGLNHTVWARCSKGQACTLVELIAMPYIRKRAKNRCGVRVMKYAIKNLLRWQTIGPKYIDFAVREPPTGAWASRRTSPPELCYCEVVVKIAIALTLHCKVRIAGQARQAMDRMFEQAIESRGHDHSRYVSLIPVRLKSFY